MQARPIRLLNTRLRITSALAITALVCANDIRKLSFGHRHAAWLLQPPLLHGSLLVVANLLIYVYVCWLAFWVIRGTHGKERFFFAGWLAGILLWPINILRPEWAIVAAHAGAFGLFVALLAALTLLLEYPGDAPV